MPRKSKAQTGLEVILIGIGIVIAGLVAVWNYLIETKLIWVVAGLILLGIIAKVYFSRKKEKERIELITSHQHELGSEISQLLIEDGLSLLDSRVKNISKKINDWGKDICISLFKKEIAIDYTDEMVLYSWGKPTTIDNQEVTSKSQKYRWIYGVPRQGASYVWFKDDKVNKIKN